MSAIQGLTVKGYFTLAAIYEEEAIYWDSRGDALNGDAYYEAHRARENARRCRERAYDMLGVVTLNPSQKLVQRSLMEVGL